MNFIGYIQFFKNIFNLWGGYHLLFAILFGLVPTIFWLWFWLQEDENKPEPRQMILKTFVVGGFFVIIAFCLERLITSSSDIIGDFHQALTTNNLTVILITISPILIWAFIEEIIKYAAAYVAAFRKKYFDEPIDAMIYMITAALGFAAIENFFFLLSTALSDGPISSSFIFTGNLRFLGATLLHIVTSATLGAFISFSFYKSPSSKKWSLFLGLITATILHTLFNFFIIIDEGKNILSVLIFLWLIATIIIFVFEIVKKIEIKKSLPISQIKN
ncbi:MAG: PrsW family glutamic-type intramembrane protease [Candidatus Paceibacterota bacterium]|jgi:RsiW-degrading membrane proteinase PrsW (M82 family)